MRFPAGVLCAFAFLSLASPQDDMNQLIDAVYRADGEAVFRSLTLENRQALSMMVTMFRLAPGEVAEQLRQELQVQLSTSEISCMQEEDLVRVILDSPMFRNEIPWPRHMVSIENCTMEGDTAVVTVTIEGEPNSYSYPMVLQEGSWKLATEFFPDN